MADRNKNVPPKEDEAISEDEILTLTDDQGKEARFEFLDMINYSGTDYAVLLPCDDNEEDMVHIFRVEDADKDVNSLVPVENEETAKAIFELFRTRNADKYDFS